MVAALNPQVVACNNRLTARRARRDQQLAKQRVNRAIQRRRRANERALADFVGSSEHYRSTGHGIDYPASLSNLKGLPAAETQAGIQRILDRGFRYLGDTRGRVTHLRRTEHFSIVAGDFEVWVRTTRREDDTEHVDHQHVGGGFGGDQVWVVVAFCHWHSRRYPSANPHVAGLSRAVVFGRFAEFYEALIRFVHCPRGNDYAITHPAWYHYTGVNVPDRFV